MKISNNIHILQDLCAIKDQPSYLIHGMPNMTNRLSYILKRLIDFNVPFGIDRFTNGFKQTFFNTYAHINDYDEDKDTLVLMAHHDVLDNEFDNFNDNSASVFILMMLAKYFNNVENLDYNLLIVFTDAEERGFSGAQRLKHQFDEGNFRKTDVIHIINLELCGVGNSMWIEDHENNSLIFENATKYFRGSSVGEIDTPSSDATFLRKKGIDNITTVGLLNKVDGEFDTSPWNVVHTARDRYENGNINDITNLFNFLKRFILEANNM